MQPCKSKGRNWPFLHFFWGPSLNATWDSSNGTVWQKHWVQKPCMHVFLLCKLEHAAKQCTCTLGVYCGYGTLCSRISPPPPSLLLVMVSTCKSTDSVSVTVPAGRRSQGCYAYLHALLMAGILPGFTIP